MLTKILDIILPPRCVLCHMLSTTEYDLCHACRKELPWLENTCEICAIPLSTSHVCAQCLQFPPNFQRTIALFYYQQPIIHLISGIKFARQLHYTKLLGNLLLAKLKNYYQQNKKPQCIVPIPLHLKRLRQRGFNQAAEIARPISAGLNIPLNRSCCTRIKATKAQAELPAKIRHKNIHAAFQVNYKPANHIAIVDDVVTTGHTITELCRMFHTKGVQQIDIWCCARTKLHNS